MGDMEQPMQDPQLTAPPGAQGSAQGPAQRPARQPFVKPTGLAGVAWRLWLPLVWILPAGLFAVKMLSESAGWEVLFLLLGSPLWIPACGFLGILPRFIMRKRGFAAAPGSVVALMVASGWGLCFGLLAMRASGDSGTDDSPLGLAFPALSPRAEDALSMMGFLVFIGAFIVALVLASALPQRTGARPHTWLALLALVLVPVVMVGVALVGERIAMHGAPDFSGKQEVDVVALTADERMAREEQAWDDAQEALVPLRERIAPGGWLVGPGGIVGEQVTGEWTTFTAQATWERYVMEEPGAAAEEARAAARDLGWQLPHSQDRFGQKEAAERVFRNDADQITNVVYQLEDERGNRLMIAEGRTAGDAAGDSEDEWRPGDRRLLSVQIVSGDYWSGGELADWLRAAAQDPDVDRSGPGSREFAADEWPELILIEGTISGPDRR